MRESELMRELEEKYTEGGAQVRLQAADNQRDHFALAFSGIRKR